MHTIISDISAVSESFTFLFLLYAVLLVVFLVVNVVCRPPRMGGGGSRGRGRIRGRAWGRGRGGMRRPQRRFIQRLR